MNADLANDLGNLAQRSLSMIAKNCAGAFPTRRGAGPRPTDLAMLARADALVGEARAAHADLPDPPLCRGGVRGRRRDQPLFRQRRAVEARQDRSGADARSCSTSRSRRCASLRSCCSRSCPRQHGQAARPARRRAAMRGLSPRSSTGEAAGRLDAPHRLAPGGALPTPSPVFPRYVEPEAPSAVRLIDSHCHLDFPDFADELDAVVARARAAGVETHDHHRARGSSKAQRLVEIAERPTTTSISPSAPIRTRRPGRRRPTSPRCARFAAHPKCVGIGEAGLDYHYDYAPPRGRQARLPRARSALARELALAAGHPHPRGRGRHRRDPEARRWGRGPSTPLLHCFTSSRALARDRARRSASMISFSGV